MTKTYFDRYFEETSKVNGYSYYTEKGNQIFSYDFDNNDLAKIFNSFAPSDKAKIKEKMVMIDFKNGDMQDFVDYIMNEYVRRDVSDKLSQYSNYDSEDYRKVEEGQVYKSRTGEKYVVIKVSKDFNKQNHLINKIGKSGKLLRAMENMVGVSNETLLNDKFFKYLGEDKGLLKTFHFRGRVK